MHPDQVRDPTTPPSARGALVEIRNALAITRIREMYSGIGGGGSSASGDAVPLQPPLTIPSSQDATAASVPGGADGLALPIQAPVHTQFTNVKNEDGATPAFPPISPLGEARGRTPRRNKRMLHGAIFPPAGRNTTAPV